MLVKIHPDAIWSEQIVYEDNHILVLNKYPSEIVQGDKTGDLPLSEKIKNFLKEREHKPGNVFVGVIHQYSVYHIYDDFHITFY